jgi:hypothetical protein
MVMPGERVGAIFAADRDTVRLIGFGTYTGNFIPPAGASIFLGALRRLGEPTPRLVMDDGQVCWDGECWWDSEAVIKAVIGERTIIKVNMEQYRNPNAR